MRLRRVRRVTTLGVGQFCTNPGLLVRAEKASQFAERIASRRRSCTRYHVAQEIAEAYQDALKVMMTKEGVETLAQVPVGREQPG